MVNKEDLVFWTNKYINNFQQFENTRSFAENTFNAKIILYNADEGQNNLLVGISQFKEKKQYILWKNYKRNTLENLNALYEG